MAAGPQAEQERQFCDFVTARSGALFRTAYLIVGDHQLAQDLLQESLVKSYVAWPRLRDVANAEAYTRRVIVTTAISWRRRRSFHERPIETPPEVVEADPTASLAVQDALWMHLQALPARQRAAIVLRHYQDFSEAQTAAVMGCTVGTVKSTVSTGLQRLRAQMTPDLDLVPDDQEVIL